MQRQKRRIFFVQWEFLQLFFVQCLQLTMNSQSTAAAEDYFCFNSLFEGFRLNVTVLQVRNVSSKFDCITECVHEPCCRSVNYKYSSEGPMECEMLHDLVENTQSDLLEGNSSYDHVYFINPQKVYNSSCFPKKIDKKVTHAISCKDALEKDSSATDGLYKLQLNHSTEVYQVFCHMTSLSSVCGGGGWTLVMQLNGTKTTFQYHSQYWTNHSTLNVADALDGFREIESKFASYSNTPFTKICVGMRYKNERKWMKLDYSASSMYSVIADGIFHETNAGRSQWKSLLHPHSSLQNYCNKEGFNIAFSQKGTYLRFGLVANQGKNCNTPNTLIGFGTEVGECKTSHVFRWSSGNVATCSGVDNGWKALPTFGYIFVQ